jgi:hypothetical protein
MSDLFHAIGIVFFAIAGMQCLFLAIRIVFGDRR